LFDAAFRLGGAIDMVFSPAGMTILQSNKAAGWQTVPHLHLHVIPRSVNDGVTLSWPRSNPPLEELRRVAARLAPVREHASANSTQKPRSFAALLNAPPGASHDEIHLDPPRG
jgi:diadenosine tetraphosphate (Ap4A) HIT family hydrolase